MDNFYKQPLIERLPYQTPNRPKDITLSLPENGRLTTSPDCGRLTTPVQEQGQLESPHVFLSPVDKGIYVINSTLDSSQVSQTTHTIMNSTQGNVSVQSISIEKKIDTCTICMFLYSTTCMYRFMVGY